METTNDTVIMVPVHSEDYKKLNEFAEAAWICRDPGRADAIKEKHCNLLVQHNHDLLKKLEKKPKKN